MTSQLDDIQKISNNARQELEEASSAEALESWRIQYIGRRGAIPQLLRTVKDLPEQQRKEIGQEANRIRQELSEAYQKKTQDFNGVKETSPETKKLKAKSVAGHLHPTTLTIRRVQNIMAALGFTIVHGPEIEQEYYDFDALNIPFEHPARAESDSFYLLPRKESGQGLVLRTSTSAVQVRTVIEQKLTPPFRIASPGRVFRNEKPDATHESMFHQIEALVVGEDVTVANYIHITKTLFSEFFGSDVNIRLRPGYFPFVEPGFEVDMTCVFCENGCSICKGTKWLEMGGAGMVHPNVLKNMNIDPEKYQGFAWGYGLDRFTLLEHSIPDIRLLWSGEIRFLKQFS